VNIVLEEQLVFSKVVKPVPQLIIGFHSWSCKYFSV